MIKILKYFKAKEWLLLLFVFAVVCLQVWCSISLPKSTLKVSDYFNIYKSGPLKDNWHNILLTCLEMVGYSFGIIICSIIVNFISSFIITSLMARVRSKIFEKVTSFSAKEISKFSLPSLITRTTNDITQLQQVLNSFISLGFNAPLTAILAIINIVKLTSNNKATALTWVNVASVLAITLVIAIIVSTAVPRFKILQRTTDNLNKVTRENLTGLKVIHAVGAEKTQEDKFDAVNTKFSGIEKFIGKVMSIIEPSMTMIMQGTSLAIIWIIGYLAKTNYDVIALMGAFTQYSIFIITAFTSLSMIFMFLPRGIISGKRINEILDTRTSILDGKGKLSAQKGTVDFINVSFKYPGANTEALKNISFKVSTGQTIAFIGPTGSGKSTLINLIPRFYDCTDGEILVDGINVKDYPLIELHNKIGYVSQKGILFSGTILDNIKYGNENANNDEIEHALKISCAEFVYNLDGGLNYHIARGGTNVSGGQKQRLSIARALVNNPEILIFDDSFSALDYKTDKSIRENLSKEFKETTKIIVAQRVGTIINADIIIVLDEGKIVGIGKHKELLKNCKLYNEIALSQLSKEELEK